MKCAMCERMFNDADTVLWSVTDDVSVCDEVCADKFDKQREQQDLAIEWNERSVQKLCVESTGCTIPKVIVNTKDRPAVVQVTVNMPSGVSADKLKDFTGETLSVSFDKTVLAPIVHDTTDDE